MKTTLKILLAIGASFNTAGAVYTFKDNTSIKAEIFEPNSDLAL